MPVPGCKVSTSYSGHYMALEYWQYIVSERKLFCTGARALSVNKAWEKKKVKVVKLKLRADGAESIYENL